MKIVKASWLITSNDESTIIKDGAVVYDSTILDVGQIEYIQEKYPDIQIKDLGENSVLMPGLINSHVHLEFSSNTTTLKYGNFMNWLNSVIKNREELVEKATQELIGKKLQSMLRTGTTTIGAISSYGLDMQPCLNSKINTVYFSEVIGSKMDMIDTLFADFKARLNSAKKCAKENFIPAIAIHSPYSVHPFLVREVLNIAKSEELAVSAHFLESPEEFEWLHKDQGGFVDFFKNFLGQEKAVTKPMEFLTHFSGIKKLSFTHCVEASEADLDKIKSLDAVINHCATSNRLLNNSKLNLENLENMDFSIGTDGLSSNNSLSLFDELRSALMIHESLDVNIFSQKLLTAATRNGAKALGLNKGQLQKECDADIIGLVLPDVVEDENDLATQIILHTKKVNHIIIGGKNV